MNNLVSPEEKRRREGIIAFARGSVRFEGVILDAATEAINTRYINGEISKAEHTRLGLAHLQAIKADHAS